MRRQKLEIELTAAEHEFTEAGRLADEAVQYKNDSPTDLHRANTAALASIAISFASIGNLFAALVRDDIENETNLSIRTS